MTSRVIETRVETVVDVSVDQMAEWFADMDDREQMEFLALVVDKMSAWPNQWAAIAHKLAHPSHDNVRAVWRSITETE